MSISTVIALTALASPQLAVSPPEAAAVEPTALPALIEHLLPSEEGGQLSWTHGLDAPVVWITRGYQETTSGGYERIGLARVTVDGRQSTVLEQGVHELAWSVILSTTAPAKFGPETIDIRVGPPGNECFGTLFEGCSFSAEQAISSPSLKIEKVCQGRVDSGNGMAVYHVRAPGKQGYLRYVVSSGSGGTSSSIEITAQPVACEY